MPHPDKPVSTADALFAAVTVRFSGEVAYLVATTRGAGPDQDLDQKAFAKNLADEYGKIGTVKAKAPRVYLPMEITPDMELTAELVSITPLAPDWSVAYRLGLPSPYPNERALNDAIDEEDDEDA
jgi:hypothetical protein